MSFSTITRAVICYVEGRIASPFIDKNGQNGADSPDETADIENMARRLGFSAAYIREVFQKTMKISLGSYIRQRRLVHAAFRLLHEDTTILEIALNAGYTHESFTRAFKKLFGMTPSAFRKERPIVGKSELTDGVYGLNILVKKETEKDVAAKQGQENDRGSAILYGVPKVGWGAYDSCTPFPICLKAVSAYLGEDVDYPFIMASGGAAFRLTWNQEQWDLCNVDIYHTFAESNEVYRLGAEALGRAFSFLGRTEETTKNEFIRFIKKHIDEGYPCIALGVIGPPEACVITGYREDGNVLLGWNFFQDDAEYAAHCKKDESGYFVCADWWENTDTQAVMCIGPVVRECANGRFVVEKALRVMTRRVDNGYAKGLLAYDAWEKMLTQDSFVMEGDYSGLFGKLLVQKDATACLWDGRGKAAQYFRRLSEETPHKKECLEAAKAFAAVSGYAGQMGELLGTDMLTEEEQLRKLAQPEIRGELCRLLRLAKKQDAKAYEILGRIYGECNQIDRGTGE